METEFHAVALGAGGARGAFQAGALLYLAEHGLRFRAVAGSSIGSINGAFLAQGDGSPGHVGELCAIWRALPDAGLMRANRRSVRDAAALLAGAAGPALGALVARLAAGRMALLDPAPLARALDRWLDYAAICRSTTSLIVAMLPEISPAYDLLTGPWRAPTYLEASRVAPRELRAALLAAVAIPIVFPANEVLARRHADAGIADPVPARVLYQRGARNIVSIFLSDSVAHNRSDFPDATLLQVRPCRPMGAPLTSMLDFSRSTVERLIDRGYADARATVGEACELAREIVVLRERGRANEQLARQLGRRGRRGALTAPAAGPAGHRARAASSEIVPPVAGRRSPRR